MTPDSHPIRDPRFALTFSGKEFLPSKGTFRPITPELIDLQEWLGQLGITRERLVDLALLVGTDFNPGIKGIGPKKALQLVLKHGRLEAMPPEIRDAVLPVADALRRLYLSPDVTDEYMIAFDPPDHDGIIRFLCEERIFSRERVDAALNRAFGDRRVQRTSDNE